MFSFACFVLFALLVSTNGQPPAECANPPKKCPTLTCCPDAIPRLLTKELMDECGFSMDMPPPPPNGPPPSGPPRGPPQCDAHVCIVKKWNLVAADNKMDRAAFKTFMESQYPAEWKPIIEKAIQTCNTQEIPADSCPLGSYAFCFMNSMTKNCPATLWNGSDECKTVKTFLEKCTSPPQ